jgi:hypothetical protein
VVFAVLGSALTIFAVVTFVLIIRKCSRPGEECAGAGIGPLFLFTTGVGMCWVGFVDTPREVRALRSPGERRELRPVYALRRPARIARRNLECAWFVFDDGRDEGLAIPVALLDAQRCAPWTAAAVHGDLRVGGRVVLRFEDEVMWPRGKVERTPPDVVGPGETYR